MALLPARYLKDTRLDHEFQRATTVATDASVLDAGRSIEQKRA